MLQKVWLRIHGRGAVPSVDLGLDIDSAERSRLYRCSQAGVVVNAARFRFLYGVYDFLLSQKLQE